MSDELLRCSFCNRSERETRKLISGPEVRICAECLELCLELLDDRVREVPRGDSAPRDRSKWIDSRQIDRAIVELQKVVNADPDDVRSRLKLGDCLAKRDDLASAAVEYLFVAQRYADDGFLMKAVAVSKQVLKLTRPDLAYEAHALLADLYSALGLESDAVRHAEVAKALLPGVPASRVRAAREYGENVGGTPPVPPRPVQARRPPAPQKASCSFCSKPQHEVRRLIAGPTVFICDECVRRAVEQL